ncbi:MAG: efflux RND transporter periplasmic adaptor subunit [Phycisphaeraceae bacterium]|nr:efflux RND transporter periplasmic adaptor subunit [Phycisphaerales bacterium]QOJ16935.1 MAG: efflux RND transporter periplasmic adaptor subunit [Phycisphaeraceae bacterium]
MKHMLSQRGDRRRPGGVSLIACLRPTGRRPSPWKGLAALPLAAVAAAWSSAVASAQQGGPPPAPVRVDVVKEEEVQSMRLVTGDLRAVKQARVATRQQGVVTELLVTEGQRVIRGDVLARQDSRQLQLELAQVEADEQAALATIEERRADLEWRQDDLALLMESRSGGAGSPKELLDARAEVRRATARLDQAERQLAVIRARKAIIEKNLADTVTTAPFDGVVIARHVELGEWAAEGAAVVDLLSTGAVEAWINVPQHEYDNVLANPLPVPLRLESTGEIIEVSGARVLPSVDPRARTFTLILTLDRLERLAAPGMSATAWVPTSERERRLTVPKTAVQYADTGAMLYVVRDGPGGAIASPVKVDIRFPLTDRFVVQSPELRPGDRVVVEGNERLFPGNPITPMPADGAGASGGGGGSGGSSGGSSGGGAGGTS